MVDPQFKPSNTMLIFIVSPQDNAIIENIKVMMRDASRELFTATRKRAYVRYRREDVKSPR